jgi:hypothetical protein
MFYPKDVSTKRRVIWIYTLFTIAMPKAKLHTTAVASVSTLRVNL